MFFFAIIIAKPNNRVFFPPQTTIETVAPLLIDWLNKTYDQTTRKLILLQPQRGSRRGGSGSIFPSCDTGGAEQKAKSAAGHTQRFRRSRVCTFAARQRYGDTETDRSAAVG